MGRTLGSTLETTVVQGERAGGTGNPSSSYTMSFTVGNTPFEAFDAINNPRGWWSTDIEGMTDRAGRDFVFVDPGVHFSKIRVTELVPGELVVWRVLDARIHFVADKAEWTGTEIRFELIETDVGTEVRFTHDGLVPTVECYDVCVNAWGLYVGGSLRNLITTGSGNPGPSPTRGYQDKRWARRLE